ncbi:DUF1801 domain-containing protein [Pelagicoccus sp. NFK12]|uniref:DUF1801 domain-containing protein n=1 Tax=Pelagicoccus enzymogenes TaxID=2773457 RepID=A0A927F7I9_9BACT|nr:DUF1801 domain-containing protein [Pelagicoccus enzymogenes]MBD5779156.1 DUF1801 domain-containing protein [Pelagicoccus enzymogenes]
MSQRPPSPATREYFSSLPPNIRGKVLELRELVLEVGRRIEPIGGVEESLKWGEPSYCTIAGSPIRIGWKANRPDRYGLYFHCQTKLVETFRELFPHRLSFEGKRAILFEKDAIVPDKELRQCIEMAFTYHRIKKLPLLGRQVASLR